MIGKGICVEYGDAAVGLADRSPSLQFAKKRTQCRARQVGDMCELLVIHVDFAGHRKCMLSGTQSRQTQQDCGSATVWVTQHQVGRNLHRSVHVADGENPQPLGRLGDTGGDDRKVRLGQQQGGCRPRRRDPDTTRRVSQDSCLANPRPRLQEITDERVLVVKRYRDADRPSAMPYSPPGASLCRYSGSPR